MTTYYCKEEIKKRTKNKCKKERTKLQQVHTQANHFNNFILKRLISNYTSKLVLSDETKVLIHNINTLQEYLKDSIKKDAERTRALIRAREKINSLEENKLVDEKTLP